MSNVDIIIVPTPGQAVTSSSPQVTIEAAGRGPTGPQGVQGFQGIQGPMGSGFTYNQPNSLTVWTINHNLGYKPSVTVYSSSNDEVIGEVVPIDLDNLTITFSSPFSGIAYLV
jgi:S1-C subfamily serine protease